MCVLCVMWEKEKLTKKEALNAALEMIETSKDDETYYHMFEVLEKLKEDNNVQSKD